MPKGTFRLTNDFGSYIVEDPEPITDSGTPCLRGRFRLEGDDWEDERGDFRVDRILTFERIHGQLEIQEAA